MVSDSEYDYVGSTSIIKIDSAPEGNYLEFKSNSYLYDIEKDIQGLELTYYWTLYKDTSDDIGSIKWATITIPHEEFVVCVNG